MHINNQCSKPHKNTPPFSSNIARQIQLCRATIIFVGKHSIQHGKLK